MATARGTALVAMAVLAVAAAGSVGGCAAPDSAPEPARDPVAAQATAEGDAGQDPAAAGLASPPSARAGSASAGRSAGPSAQPARSDSAGVSVGLVVPGKANLGEPAPPFALVAPDDRVISLAAFAGRPVVLNFFATWCGPCRAEMPMLQRAHEAHEADGLAVVGIDLREDAALVVPFLTELGVTFPVGLDRHGAVADAYRVATLPTTYFVDAGGDVATSRVGVFPTEDELAAALRQILPGAAP